MNKTIRYIIGLVVLVLAIIFILRLSENRSYKVEGQALVEKIENFKEMKGKLPDSISELGIDSEMGEGPYYKKESDSTYIVYFNIGFDNSLVFSSNTKKWIEKP